MEKAIKGRVCIQKKKQHVANEFSRMNKDMLKTARDRIEIFLKKGKPLGAMKLFTYHSARECIVQEHDVSMNTNNLLMSFIVVL